MKPWLDAYVLAPNEPCPAGPHATLPASLHDAIRAVEDSELMPQILGEQVFEYFLRNKRAEWQDYRLQVTPYELQRNLGIL